MKASYSNNGPDKIDVWAPADETFLQDSGQQMVID